MARRVRPLGSHRQDIVELPIRDVDHVTRMIEDAPTTVAFREVFCRFGEGIFAPDRCKKTLELFAEKGIPCFR